MEKGKQFNKFTDRFITFVNVALIFLIFLVVVETYSNLKKIKGKFSLIDGVFLIFLVGIIYIFKILKEKNIKSKNIVIFLVSIGFIIRIVWVFSIDSIPISDYSRVYEAGIEILNGNFQEFHGIGYFARFPHLIVPVLFSSLLKVLFGTNILIGAKIINCIFSSIGILGIYLLSNQIFKRKIYGEISALIMALYPPIILYTAVYCNENQAIPFYIFSIYIFLKYVEGESYKMMALTGMILAIGNLFRMVAMIVLVAFLLYIGICRNEKITEKIKKITFLISGFWIPILILSVSLKTFSITDQHLWAGSEPKITNILKGTNMEHGGGWSHEDAIIPDTYNFDKQKIEEVCKKIIWERIAKSTPQEFIEFYYKKYTGIWSNGEFSGAYWAEHGLENSKMAIRISQQGIWYVRAFYLVLIVLSFIGLFNKETINKGKQINLMYFIFCGYGIMFLITERQDRYTFIVCWIFIILGMNGINLIEKRLGASKWKSLD